MNEEALFDQALATPAGARSAFLEEACAGDPRLRQRLEVLLHAHEHPGSFLGAPAPGLAATVDEAITERPGAVIGPYKLLEQIGEGGFGVVFMADQQQPVRRKVALKILKPGMDTLVIARFDAERQALALMDHPNIARVLDAGTIGRPHAPREEVPHAEREVYDGRPYFVMELVRGPSMTDYCDQHNLPVRERMMLFIDVCQAVQHAHQKGIIHRDIKPSNVLVTRHDGKPVVKVIDFGIAKAMGQQLTEKTLFTNFAQMIGTPLYMSPEQAEMSGLDVDTRSDIYSLGVLLYELLTGSTPFDRERLKQAGFDEIRRIIREEEAPKPSTRMSTIGQSSRHTPCAVAENGTQSVPTTSTIAAHRQSDPRKLSRLFRGELDWIVMKALEKDRNRRYETASAFAADVQRYWKDEAVQACPPSAWYRFRKFGRRNKVALATGALVSSALVLAVVVLAVSNVRISEETNRANREADDAKTQWDRAEDNLREVKAERQRMARLLDQAKDFSSYQLGLPDLLLQSGRPQDAEQVHRKIIAFWEAVLADAPGDRTSWEEVGGHYWLLAGMLEKTEQYPKAVEAYNRAVSAYAKLLPEGPVAREDLASADFYGNAHLELGALLRDLGRFEEAETSYQCSLDIWQRLREPDNWRLSRVHTHLGELRATIGAYHKAEKEYSEALDLLDKLDRRISSAGKIERERARIQNSLGNLLWDMGRADDAEKAYRQVNELLWRTMVSSPKRKAWQLATCPHPAVRDALKAVELATSSPPDQRDADAWRTLGAAQYYAGNAQDAIDALNKSIVLRTGDKALGALNRFIELRTRDKCLDWFFLAMAQQQLDKKEDARRFYDRATEWMEKNKPGNPDLRRFRAEAAKVLGIEEKGLPK